jgi:hypothetical protein
MFHYPKAGPSVTNGVRPSPGMAKVAERFALDQTMQFGLFSRLRASTQSFSTSNWANMFDFISDPQFDPCRDFIERSRQNGKGWDYLQSLNRTLAKLDEWLVEQEEMNYWPSLGTSSTERHQVWLEIVAAKKSAEELSFAATRPLVIVGPDESEPDIKVPLSKETAWQGYRSYLEGQGWKKVAVDNIENSALHILRRMRRNTVDRGAVKGLVVGHVQSGKTANMAGLISMAADYRWNLFIVLSGTLENLRVQTRNRLIKDIFPHQGTLSWQAVEHPSTSKPVGERAQDMQFHQGCNDRHLVVSLKNASRLAGLIGWISKDKLRMKQMRIVIIDDEADQGGINTANVSKEERSRINGLIVDLVNLPVQCVNYIAYTATPAANFLNEEPGGSLYPKDFIVALRQSDEHFGPLQVFGLPATSRDPLGIVLTVPSDDLEKLRAIHAGESLVLPDTLRESILWFLCCTAAMRLSGFRKPVSMLIHSSAAQRHHANVEIALRSFLDKCTLAREKFLRDCAEVWAAHTADISVESFGERFADYGNLANLVDYPDFSDLAKELLVLISKITAIELDGAFERTYHSGIHVCVDNCANNNITNENEIKRLFYPDPDNPQPPDIATAFIVIGGGTLSRGLTIENLVSTFFLRASAQADSLMQMGRWFGYRKGYELLPRIWMPEITREKFEFMTIAEEELRDDLEQYMKLGADPSLYGPRVRVHPSMSWLRPTAKARMQSQTTAEFDFSGVNRQTTLFHDGDGAESAHIRNRSHTEEFLNKVGLAEKGQGNSLVWRNVDATQVASFLEGFQFHPASQFFSEITPFLVWLKEQAVATGYRHWNVVAAGSDPIENRQWKLPGGAVGVVARSRIIPARSDGAVSIGTLRDPRDLLADVVPGTALPIGGNLGNTTIIDCRDSGEVGEVPQLLLYLIDKDSKRQSKVAPAEGMGKKIRSDLNAKADIVGISLWLPGVKNRKKSFVTHVTVRIRPNLAADNDDLPGTGEEYAT